MSRRWTTASFPVAAFAALGFTFYTGDMIPSTYKNAANIAEHGSWNRTPPSG